MADSKNRSSSKSPEPALSAELSYAAAGVNTSKKEAALNSALAVLKETWDIRGNVELDFGHFANVVVLGQTGVAISTDSIGTKSIISQLVGKYDTVGIDCVAINVNDVLCVGARPECMVDYIAVHEIVPSMIKDISKGLANGARVAGITIVGGESAQLPELIQSEFNGGGFDLAGTCIGTTTPGEAVTGARVQPNDIVVGIKSSGVHSNGLSLARKAFGITSDKTASERRRILEKHHPEIGKTLGEELLVPTRIYVPEVLAMLQAGIDIRGIAHISGDGLLNLPRLLADTGYIIDSPPEPHPIFYMIQEYGNIPSSEMYSVFNMGVGFCLIMPEGEINRALDIAKEHGAEASAIGRVIPDPLRSVEITGAGLLGWRGKGFHKTG